ncbi:MAG TPA: Cys-tRNA(Pro) deacylase [Spirochaetia bacterium]|nr:Cys-tRNA(Pro) deacylase [Spirochaetia bacterium]
MTTTNAMRILRSLGVPYEVAEYSVGEEHVDAVSVARELGAPPEIVFKTLVARTDRNEPVVFCIPGPSELNLKKAANAVGARKVDLVPLKDLTVLTGYVRGGCSPIGMKKKYPTWIDEIALAYDRIYVNAGARGLQVIVTPGDLCRAAEAMMADLV